MTDALKHFLREEESYWSIQSLLRMVIKGMWVMLYGNQVIGFSETKDEMLRHFNKFVDKMDPRKPLPSKGAICVQVGNENKVYRIPLDKTTDFDT